MIDSKTKLVCLLGRPASHSLSPAMHNAGYAALGLNYAYLAFEPESLGKAVAGLRCLGAAGFNVTMPFKADIIRELDAVDAVARKIGTVNTVVNSRGRLVGYNTDGLGALNALKTAVKVRGKSVLLLGAGGAGSAIAFFLLRGKARLTIADRNSRRAKALAQKCGAKHLPFGKIKTLAGFDIIINATPAGMRPHTGQTPVDTRLLHRGLVVFDIVYDPLETRLLREARKRGCKCISGIEMLLEQGYAGFRLFTGKEAPRRAMRKALMESIKGRK